MAKNKRNIDFIAAQKAISSAGHGPTFEIALVVTVIIVAAGMITWYVLTNKSYNTTNENIAALEQTLEDKNAELAQQEKKFKSYYVCDGQDGRSYSVVGTNKDGTSVYETISITEIATQYANAVINAQATSDEVKGVIDITSTVLDMIIEGASASGNELESFSLSSTGITLNLKASKYSEMKQYYEFLNGTGKSFYSGCSTSYYLTNVSIKSYTEGTDGSYTYVITMSLIGDALYND